MLSERCQPGLKDIAPADAGRCYNLGMSKASEGPKTAAIFDLDGTLFTGHFWHGVVEHHLGHGIKLPQTLAYLATHYPLWLGHKLGMLSEEACKTRWGEDLALLLKGFSGEEMNRIFNWIDADYFAGRLRRDMAALLKRHREQGHITIVLSGSYQDFLEVINGRLGADYVVGTRLEMGQAGCTGRTEKPLCFGQNKVGLLKQLISHANLKIDLAASFAYADSLTDAPVLEMVGNPVAAYPDKGLLKLARQKGWRALPDGMG